jgi:hypothetical protein
MKPSTKPRRRKKMPDDIKAHLDKLAELAPDAKARIETALKTNIEAELAKTPGAGLAGKEFSRGIIFSRSRGKLTTQLDDQAILNEVKTMDEATFSKFASRLGALKNLKEGGPK